MNYGSVMRWSIVLLIGGLCFLLIGAILSVLKLQPYSDYALVAGAMLVVFRGVLRNRERDNN